MTKLKPVPTQEYAEAHMWALISGYYALGAIHDHYLENRNNNDKSVVYAIEITLHEAGWHKTQTNSSGNFVVMSRTEENTETSEERFVDTWETSMYPQVVSSSMDLPPDAQVYAYWSEIRHRIEEERPTLAIIVSPTGDGDKPYVAMVSTITSNFFYMKFEGDMNQNIEIVGSHHWENYDLEMWDGRLSSRTVSELVPMIQAMFQEVSQEEIDDRGMVTREAILTWIDGDGKKPDIANLIAMLAESNGAEFVTEAQADGMTMASITMPDGGSPESFIEQMDAIMENMGIDVEEMRNGNLDEIPEEIARKIRAEVRKDMVGDTSDWSDKFEAGGDGDD